jgi:hypothetical protein
MYTVRIELTEGDQTHYTEIIREFRNKHIGVEFCKSCKDLIELATMDGQFSDGSPVALYDDLAIQNNP